MSMTIYMPTDGSMFPHRAIHIAVQIAMGTGAGPVAEPIPFSPLSGDAMTDESRSFTGSRTQEGAGKYGHPCDGLSLINPRRQ